MKKNVHPAKIYYFHFLKVILLFIVVSVVHLILDCVIYTDIMWVFNIPRPLIKILHAPEPKNPLAGLGLGGDLPNTFQQLATMFMQSAKGRHRIGTLHIFYQSEA